MRRDRRRASARTLSRRDDRAAASIAAPGRRTRPRPRRRGDVRSRARALRRRPQAHAATCPAPQAPARRDAEPDHHRRAQVRDHEHPPLPRAASRDPDVEAEGAQLLRRGAELGPRPRLVRGPLRRPLPGPRRVLPALHQPAPLQRRRRRASASNVPDAKLLYMVRDPISRILSPLAPRHRRRLRDRGRWRTCSSRDDQTYVTRSMYWMQLQPYLELLRPRADRGDHPGGAAGATARGRCARPSRFAGVDEDFTSEQFDREWEKSTRQGVRPVPVHGEADQAARLPLLRPQLRPPARAHALDGREGRPRPRRARRPRSPSCPTRSSSTCSASSARTSRRSRSSPGREFAALEARTPSLRDEDRGRSRRAGRASPRPSSRSCASAATSRPARRPRRRRARRLGLGQRGRRPRRRRGPRRAGGRLLLDRHRRLDRRQQGRRGSAPRSAATPRRPRAPATGTTPTRWRSACASTSEAELGEILDAWFARRAERRGRRPRQRRAPRRDRGPMRRGPGDAAGPPAAARRRPRPRSPSSSHGLDLVAAPLRATAPTSCMNFVATLDGRATIDGRSGPDRQPRPTRRCCSGCAPASTR